MLAVDPIRIGFKYWLEARFRFLVLPQNRKCLSENFMGITAQWSFFAIFFCFAEFKCKQKFSLEGRATLNTSVQAVHLVSLTSCVSSLDSVFSKHVLFSFLERRGRCGCIYIPGVVMVLGRELSGENGGGIIKDMMCIFHTHYCTDVVSSVAAGTHGFCCWCEISQLT